MFATKLVVAVRAQFRKCKKLRPKAALAHAHPHTHTAAHTHEITKGNEKNEWNATEKQQVEVARGCIWN